MSRRLLILIVDRDNDIGESTRWETPIVGVESVRQAALEFAVARPEDSDVNVMFAGIQMYEKLRGEGRDVEIAVVGGDARDLVRADLRISEQLEALKRQLGFEEVLLVTDGAEDEAIIPIVQSYARIAGVRRVIVEQMRGIEETYILIGRYIKKALVEPRFSRLFLGIPGLLLLSLVGLYVSGYLDYAAAIAGLLIGGAMVIRGFNLEEKIYEFWGSSPIMFIASTLATISLITGAALMVNSLRNYGLTLHGLGDGISAGTPFIGLSVFSILVGKAVVKLINRDVKVWHDIVGMVLTVIGIMAFTNLGETLLLLPQNPGSQGLRAVLFDSGFVQLMLIGIGLSGVLTLVATLIEKRLQQEPGG